MKSQKGVTLISLTIYVIVMTIVIGIVSVVSTYFYKNVGVALETVNPVTQYNNFNIFFTDEINHQNIRTIKNAGKLYVSSVFCNFRGIMSDQFW